MAKGKRCILCNVKTKRPFPEVTEDYSRQLHTTKNRHYTRSLTMLYNRPPWVQMSTSSISDINIEYSSAIKEKLPEKRELRKI